MEYKLENWQWKILAQFDDIVDVFNEVGYWEDKTRYKDRQYNPDENAKLIVNVADIDEYNWFVDVANGLKYRDENYEDFPEEIKEYLDTDSWDVLILLEEKVKEWKEELEEDITFRLQGKK